MSYQQETVGATFLARPVVGLRETKLDMVAGYQDTNATENTSLRNSRWYRTTSQQRSFDPMYCSFNKMTKAWPWTRQMATS